MKYHKPFYSRNVIFSEYKMYKFLYETINTIPCTLHSINILGVTLILAVLISSILNRYINVIFTITIIGLTVSPIIICFVCHHTYVHPTYALSYLSCQSYILCSLEFSFCACILIFFFYIPNLRLTNWNGNPWQDDFSTNCTYR